MSRRWSDSSDYMPACPTRFGLGRSCWRAAKVVRSRQKLMSHIVGFDMRLELVRKGKRALAFRSVPASKRRHHSNGHATVPLTSVGL